MRLLSDTQKPMQLTPLRAAILLGSEGLERELMLRGALVDEPFMLADGKGPAETRTTPLTLPVRCRARKLADCVAWKRWLVRCDVADAWFADFLRALSF